ncbi:MAG: class I lanthipeptide [Bacteroidales bacterium]|jgi:natural product precursor|nr:class I lanthipeptide [Bacteroidales bacterium]
MEPKKIKKLVLNKEIISNLTENEMSYVKGGKDTDGTGYGMCICNPTDKCCISQIGSCPGLHTTEAGYCYCA